jgi:lysophospholipase L1-like esterase
VGRWAKGRSLGCALALAASSCTSEGASKNGQAARLSADAAGSDAVAQAPLDRGPAAPEGSAGSVATVHYMGRFDWRDPAGPRFAWPGTGIAATFVGTGLEATLSDTGHDILAVAIDGATPRAVATAGAGKVYTLASKLAPGQHTVVLTKRTEASVGVEQLLALTPLGGALVPSPPLFTRRIEFIGDSIVCGYGVLGTDCRFSPETEDEGSAFGAIASAALHAQRTVIAYSGKGMYRDIRGSTVDQMPVLFNRVLPDDPTSLWDFAAPAPDVVVIELSSNDFTGGDPGDVFERAYVAFLQQLRRRYPHAYVLCALSSMVTGPDRTNAADSIVGAVQMARSAGVTRVSTLEVPAARGTFFGFAEQLATDGYGCDGHPSLRTHLMMGQQLATAIPLVTGW